MLRQYILKVIRLSQINSFFLVVDANVIGYTTENPLDARFFKASEILCRIVTKPHRIVLDLKRGNEETILDEYQRQMAKSQLARQWLIALQAGTEKIVYRHRANVHLKVLSDPDDEKYIQVAVNSPHKIIISEDSDLSTISDEVEVKNLGIKIWEFDIALNQL